MNNENQWLTRMDDPQIVVENGGRIVCRMDESPCSRMYAERNLIVQAPDLLRQRDALAKALRAITDEVSVLCDDDYAGTCLETLRNKAHAALALVEGGKP
jgi:hypothetical protein